MRNVSSYSKYLDFSVSNANALLIYAGSGVFLGHSVWVNLMPRVHLACFQVSGVDCDNMHVPSPTCVKYINYKPHREQMFSNIMELSSFTKKRKIMLKTYLQGALLGGKML